jgi:hypothetical protein
MEERSKGMHRYHQLQQLSSPDLDYKRVRRKSSNVNSTPEALKEEENPWSPFPLTLHSTSPTHIRKSSIPRTSSPSLSSTITTRQSTPDTPEPQPITIEPIRIKREYKRVNSSGGGGEGEGLWAGFHPNLEDSDAIVTRNWTPSPTESVNGKSIPPKSHHKHTLLIITR